MTLESRRLRGLIAALLGALVCLTQVFTLNPVLPVLFVGLILLVCGLAVILGGEVE